MNPYILQVDKLAESLRHLSEVFLTEKAYKGRFTAEELEEMFLKVSDKVCAHCESRGWCLGENRNYTRQMLYEILCTVEEYGAELNTEVKRKLQKRCELSSSFLREALDVFGEAKQKLMWNNRLVQNREGCAFSLVSFAGMIQDTTRDLGRGIVSEEKLEKKFRQQLAKFGVKVLNCIFYINENGKYEVHVTMKAGRGQCIVTKEVAKYLSKYMGKNMVVANGELPLLWKEYHTVIFLEAPQFYTRQSVAKIGRGCEVISGDTFTMTELSGQKRGIVLSDGMGTGERAFQESTRVIEMMEELLKAGFPEETGIQMLNTALVLGREEIHFSTIDMCVFDLYTGNCELFKAGASTTFIKRGNEVERIHSTSLPVGVLQKIEIDKEERQLVDGDQVIMVTDGVLDAISVGKQEVKLAQMIEEIDSNNPKEMAHAILEKVLESTGEMPQDDMTVIVVGIWEL